ncbi:ABC transporter substrate-binding protein [Streptomyces atacamensis]|uniref:ABC transporter substrate-binding protein n=1 Tax=Streptomyces atacamensis TaxID=531966 RepID=UPI00399CDE79
MATPAPNRFPDDTGADIFVREYPTAVVPDAPGYLTTRPPLLVLHVPGHGEEYEIRVRRVINALVDPLSDGGKLVPYAILQAGSDSDLLAGEAGKQLAFGIPGNMTPDRFPDFELLRDTLAYVREHPGDWTAPAAKELRDHAYRRRAERGGLPGLLWSLGGKEAPPATGLRGWLLRTWWLSLTRTLPRWLWARRKTARLVRPGRLSLNRRSRWLGTELNVRRSGEDLFGVMDAVAARQAPRLALPADHPRHAEALQAVDRLLLRALLEDLGRPSVGRVLPKRRRRRARPVILLEMPRDAADGAQAAERFLRSFRQAGATVGGPGPLVVAVGRISGTLRAELDPEECNLSQAGLLLHEDAHRPVWVGLREEPFSRAGLPVRRVSPRRFRLSWRTQTSVLAGSTALAVSLLGVGGVELLSGPERDTGCAGGGTAAVAELAEPVPVEPKKWYDEMREVIDRQNARAVRFAEEEDRTVRTVVHFGSDEPTDRTDTLFDGTIPELRGIAMWQGQILREAGADESLVPLVVDVRTTGKGFKDAAAEARELVEEVREADRRGVRNHETVVGVLGFAQSKEATRDALDILESADIPVVGTTATADEMLVSQTYWPFTPLNSDEARMAAEFATTSNIVARPEGADGCVPARHAVVVQNSDDLYSASLAGKFTKWFPGDEQLVNFSQEGAFGTAPPGSPNVTTAAQLAGTVCEMLGSAGGDPIVYWSARARDFTAFVNAFDKQGTCVKDGLTVLGGNELTNVALTGEYADKAWLRLYHSAHRLPTTDKRASWRTQRFAREYDALVGGPSKADPWRHDGHSAVSYDAFHMLSQAVDGARSGRDVHRSAVLAVLRGGVSFEGATGYVHRPLSPNRPPADKTLVLLRQTDGGPVVVGVCGAYEGGVKSQDQGPLCAAD